MARRAKEPPALATLHQEPLRATLAAAKKISVQMCKINCKSQSWNVPRDLPTIANQCQKSIRFYANPIKSIKLLFVRQ